MLLQICITPLYKDTTWALRERKLKIQERYPILLGGC